MTTAAEIFEALANIQGDVEDVERNHQPTIDRSRCVRCTETWPCRGFACATWLRRLVLERIST